MKVRFWGARGSIPTPMSEAELQDKIKTALLSAVGVDLTDREAVDRFVERLPSQICTTAGGNTSCIEVRVGDALFILDCGSGMRLLGNELLKGPFGKGQGEAHVFVTHTHWDHVQGLPFFNPAYVPGNVLHFYSPYPDLQMRFEDQQREVYYPVPLDYMRSTRTWQILDPTEALEIDGVKVRLTLLSHPGGSYAYRFENDGQVFVYATDGEYHRMDTESTAHYVEFFRDADLLVFDAQYSFDTWLYRMVTNVAIDFLRSKQSREAAVASSLRLVKTASDGEQSVSLQRKEVEAVFAEVSSVLSPKQRTIFVMREMEDISSAEISRILGCRESTVRNHLFNARKQMQEQLRNRFPEYASLWKERS